MKLIIIEQQFIFIFFTVCYICYDETSDDIFLSPCKCKGQLNQYVLITFYFFQRKSNSSFRNNN